ncbi:hypothetical protein [Chengkuizengella axinellae]|uniref:Uncharacterized protein n=1 Tax=Chengkuizengella axinellae TaxID=3064388 RepID=A0ABT9IWS9_9BACL|nr:hypothetical protein [Chengkuizengella sp. 2205SS18-9]MDP5273777.1 hypothetical protein [Chengkuizengella sp. 2205SS18-9]
MSNQRNHTRFEEIYIAFSTKVEKYLIKFLFVLTIVLITVQLLSQFEYVRLLLINVEKLEGIPYE